VFSTVSRLTITLALPGRSIGGGTRGGAVTIAFTSGNGWMPASVVLLHRRAPAATARIAAATAAIAIRRRLLAPASIEAPRAPPPMTAPAARPHQAGCGSSSVTTIGAAGGPAL